MKSESVKTWIDGIKPEHGVMAQKVDSLIKELIPEIQFHNQMAQTIATTRSTFLWTNKQRLDNCNVVV